MSIKKQFRSLRSASLGVIVLVSLLIAAGCGGGDDSSSDTSAAATTGGTEASSTSELAGKKIGYLDIFGPAPIQQRFSNAFKYAAKELGWTVDFADGVGDPAKSLAAFEGLIADEPDAIVTSSIPAEFIRPAVASAKEKGIPLVTFITEPSPGVYDATINEVQGPYSEGLSKTIKSEFPDGGEIGIITGCENAIELARQETMVEELEDSNLQTVGDTCVPIANPRVAEKSAVDLLNSNPNIVAFVATSDQLPQYILGALRTTGNEDVKIYCWYADSTNVALMKENENFVAATDSNIAVAPFIAANELVKFFQGGEMTPSQDADIKPIVVFTPEIKGAFGKALEADEGPVPYAELIKPYVEQWK